MKVGTVLSTCIHDLVINQVNESDVLLILDVVGYDFYRQEEWDRCWVNMTRGTAAMTTWHNLDEELVKETVLDLFTRGKIHPYKHSSFVHGPIFWTPWLNLTIPDEHLDEIPLLRQTWEDYTFISKLNQLNKR